MKPLQYSITDQSLRDNENRIGMYNLAYSGNTLTVDGVEHVYNKSGLCRETYRTLDKTRVMKVPTGNIFVNDEDAWELYERIDVEKYDAKGYGSLPISVKHNIIEAQVYEAAPEDMKKYLAECFMLECGIVSQEWVEVFNVHRSAAAKNLGHLNFEYYGPANLREAGVTNDGRVVIFDYDPWTGDYDSFWETWDRTFNFSLLEEKIRLLERICPYPFVSHFE